MRRTALLLLPLLAAPALAGAQVKEPPAEKPGVAQTPENYPYVVEDIPTPDGLVAENGGLDFLPDGRVVAVFHHGEVMIYDPARKEWSVFATGLHDPLGVVALSEREMIVAQRPEITRIRDTDGDGKADAFETISDDFGMSGNYAEFTHGPVMDAEGALYFSLNTASNNGPVRKIIRGTYSPRGRIGRMFSAVPYRGWVMKVTPDGRTVPFASGFRSPNGLVLDRDGNLFVTDNQGDWLGSSKLFLVQPGKFYGHVPSLAWEEGINTIPATIPLPVLERMRQKEILLFPYGILANSPTQPLFDYTGGKFGPFEGQMFVGEMNHHLLMRVMLEEVNHQLQGAVAPFINQEALKLGSNRLAFGPDGSLWVGHTDHGWLGDKGIQRIRWTGKTPLDVHTMSITPEGFDLTFTQPVDAKAAGQAASYRFKRYRYDYHLDYGSDRMDMGEVGVREARLSPDGRSVSLALDELAPGYVYQLDLDGITGRDGTPLVNSTLYYTVNQLRQVGAAAPAAAPSR
jgi:glucose/arabinose dehydrogenase